MPVQRPVAAGTHAFSFYAFILAVLIYGLWGAPTPDRFGPAELAMAALLIGAVGPVSALAALMRPGAARWQQAGWLFLIYGLTLPVLVGIASGNAPQLVLRDIIPFLFWMLPLLIPQGSFETPQRKSVLISVVALVGLLFAARLVAAPILSTHQSVALTTDPQYLANAPTVLFAAFLFLGMGGRMLMATPLTVMKFGAGIVFLLSAAIPLLAMAVVTQRATMGLLAAGIGLLGLAAFIHRPVRALLPLALGCLTLALFRQEVFSLLHGLMTKTSLVGFNNRFEEFRLVVDLVAANPFTILFGYGWGETIASPAVGGVTVNFTHSFFSSLWLKTGLIGMALGAAYVAGFLRLVAGRVRRSPILCLALGAPLLIDVTLYASYKSFDFGLVLLMIATFLKHPDRSLAVAPARPVVYSQSFAPAP